MLYLSEWKMLPEVFLYDIPRLLFFAIFSSSSSLLTLMAHLLQHNPEKKLGFLRFYGNCKYGDMEKYFIIFRFYVIMLRSIYKSINNLKMKYILHNSISGSRRRRSYSVLFSLILNLTESLSYAYQSIELYIYENG